MQWITCADATALEIAFKDRKGHSRASRRVTLEQEARVDRRSELSPRNRGVVFRKLGIDGNGGSTLEEAGDDIGLTRERVRQLVQKFVRHLGGRGRLYLPTFDRVVATMVSLSPAPANLVEARLVDKRLTAKRFRLEGVWSSLRSSVGAPRW